MPQAWAMLWFRFYHVAELARAVGGDRVTVEIISPSNVPVHDYEPSASDLIRLQDTDLFFYHGLNLEPWVDATISSLGSDAPIADTDSCNAIR